MTVSCSVNQHTTRSAGVRYICNCRLFLAVYGERRVCSGQYAAISETCGGDEVGSGLLVPLLCYCCHYHLSPVVTAADMKQRQFIPQADVPKLWNRPLSLSVSAIQ